MVNVIYNDSIPDAPNNPSQDQPKMQTNTNSIRSLIEFDHVGFGNNHGGYHKVIHQETQTVVNTVAGVNQIFSGIPGQLIVNGVTTSPVPNNNDTQLYALTGLGGLAQITGSFVNTVNSTGYQWIGGILYQWGFVNGTHSGDNHFNGGDTNTVLFPIAFPNKCFQVQTSPAYGLGAPSSNSGMATVALSAILLPNAFAWTFISNSTAYIRFYWSAIGS